MRSSKPLGLAAMAAAAALTLTACGGGDDGGSGAGGEGGGSGESVRIGIKFDQPGLGYRDGSEYTGFDVDVAKYVACELGYAEDAITWVSAPSAQRENMLQTGQVDMIFATYSITDARKEVVSFAGPYFVAGQDLLVTADNDAQPPEVASIHRLEGRAGPGPASRAHLDADQRSVEVHGDQVELALRHPPSAFQDPPSRAGQPRRGRGLGPLPEPVSRVAHRR